MEFISPDKPPEAYLPSQITDVLQSKEVVVQIKDYYAIARYTKDTLDPALYAELGCWNVNGHTGNWDKYIKGWHPLPDLIEQN